MLKSYCRADPLVWRQLTTFTRRPGGDFNLVVGQKHNATVDGDMQENIQSLRKSVAGISQRLQAGGRRGERTAGAV